MPRMPRVAQRAEQLLGCAVASTAPIAGGDVSATTKVRLSNGRLAVFKTRHQSPPDFFVREAEGLRWLAETGTVHVPEVLAVAQDCLIISWVEPGRPTPEGTADFGRSLAALHSVAAEEFGGVPNGYIGVLPLPNRSASTWAEFYAVRRVLPYLKLAVDRGQIDPRDAGDIESVIGKITELVGPEESPVRVHGDLWNGNVVWGADGAAHLIDPAAYAGHREVDVAMLSLFGLPQLQRVLDAYDEVKPLADGWEDRIGLHQLFPLLVHACHFGRGYGARAGEAARRYK